MHSFLFYKLIIDQGNELSEEEYADVLKSFGLPEGLTQAIASWDIGASKGDLFDDKKVLSELIGRPTTPLVDTVKKALNS